MEFRNKSRKRNENDAEKDQIRQEKDQISINFRIRHEKDTKRFRND